MAERFAPAERNTLADALLAAGPDAPTLCDGWTTRDLAAHLVLRERKPLAAAGIMLKPLAARTKRVQDQLAAGDYPALVTKFRTPGMFSPARVPALDELTNTVEYFIHTEDVRRGVPDWTPRPVSPALEAVLLKRAKMTARMSTRKFPATIVGNAPGAEPFQVGSGPDTIEVTGAPGELLLFFAGRQQAADVTLTGPDALVSKLRTTSLGM